jgi:Tol biopolymer transport system component
MKPRLLCLVACISFLSISAVTQTTPHPVTVDDYFQVKDVADPQISADGQWIAYTVATATLKADKNETRIWMMPSAGGDAIPMTAEGNSSTHPRWSPDGKYLAFLSERNEGKTQVWLLDRRGGEAQQLTETIQDVDGFEWAPDSKRLVLVIQDPSTDEKDEAEAKKKCDADDKECKAKKEDHKPRAIVIDRYRFKEDEVGYLDRRRNHLYVFDIA